ncbi:mus-41 [Symbiodinium pilosum]|uniref:Mus-41 protein n=1 Tax=Symbiodinium pilosum TaxID=2952 RepID=A0A812JIL5_SYMPI|nr:mus-41 [Symbiodinium pilosum]
MLSWPSVVSSAEVQIGPEQVGVIDIDIEEEADSGVAAKGRSKGRKRKSRGVAEEQRKQTRVEKKAPIPSEPSRAGRGPSEETLCEAETECENGSASNVHSDKAVGTDLPPEVQAQLRALGLGWSCAPEGSWARFSPKMQKHPQSLLQDPPCLSLQGQSERNQEACNCIGDMHSAAKAGVQDQFALQLDSGIKVLLDAKTRTLEDAVQLRANMLRICDLIRRGHAAVSDRLLNSLFETLLAKAF